MGKDKNVYYQYSTESGGFAHNAKSILKKLWDMLRNLLPWVYETIFKTSQLTILV